MAQEVFVALFDTLAEAEAAQRDLEGAGIRTADINIRSQDARAAAPAAERHEGGGFFDWLFGSSAPEADVDRYRTHIESRGGALLSVRADSAEYDRIADILEGHNLTKVDETQEDVATAPTVMPPPSAELPEAPAATTPPRQAREAGEAVIPTAREELEIGKRRTQDTRHFRVRRYTVERPVEQQVNLHDERVTIERRPPTAAGTTGERPFEDKIVEVTETREEPVVSKVVRPGEEVVVHKEGQERVETVRGTARESKVEIDRAAAGNKPGEPPLREPPLRDRIDKKK